MQKKVDLKVVALVLLFACTALVPSPAAGSGDTKKPAPFLITGGMPHLTKLLMRHWDSPDLKLSDEQKSRLLVIRQETISAVKRVGRAVAPLERQVAEGIMAGSTAAELQPLVTQVADLKREATMVHLRCIQQTRAVLDERQLEFILGGE